MDRISVVDKTVIASGLRALGLCAGDGVMVHSSLKSLGRVDGGPATVIAALMEVLTAEGTLMMPSFNHAKIFEPDGPGIFDPKTTPTINGAIPDMFWRMPGVYRSMDPTHAFAAWGKNAERYIKSHHCTLTMGPDSPLGLLGREGGWVLLLGVGYNTNTYHHVVEMTTKAPCLGLRSDAYPVRLADGRIVSARTWGWRNATCPIDDTAIYSEELVRLGLERTAQIGLCHAKMFRASDCFDVVARLLREGYQGCPPCSRCPIRPLKMAVTVESDWDEQNNCLKPDSVGWTY
ncbi:MAG: aminoglycoside N(3)-acetyltransferase [Planctomycetaceae bacterium]|nr:MAG: aminoglycoside N(3)-acetyltransferase [Planctomycetaceae bacterium]